MDTRTKIIGLDKAAELLRSQNPTVVSGTFDPLTLAHARRLAELPGPLLVLVGEPAAPLLPLDARVQLVAALRDVLAVVAVPGPLDEALDRLGVTDAVREEAADDGRREALLLHIRNRHEAAPQA